MRTRCGPLTAFALTFAVEMSASSVRDVIPRVAETVMPLPETRFGASASAVPEPPSSDRPTTTAAMNARTRGPANMDPLPVGRPRTVQRTRAFIKRAALRSRLPMVKLVFVIRRRADLPAEEFHRYWLEGHGPLARRLLATLGAGGDVPKHHV